MEGEEQGVGLLVIGGLDVCWMLGDGVGGFWGWIFLTQSRRGRRVNTEDGPVWF